MQEKFAPEEKITRMALLHDVYAGLLTEKQSEAVRLFYEEDLSLSEIAELFSTTRQAVHDLLKRTESLLEYYEDKLGCLVAQKKDAQFFLRLEETARALESAPTPALWKLFWEQIAKKEGE